MLITVFRTKLSIEKSLFSLFSTIWPRSSNPLLYKRGNSFLDTQHFSLQNGEGGPDACGGNPTSQIQNVARERNLKEKEKRKEKK